MLMLILSLLPAAFTCPRSYAASAAGADASSATPVTDADIAWFYAPIHFQDTNPAREGPEGDYLTAFDYDGNFVGTDNWDNFTVYPFEAYAYYSLVETCTHWFVLYVFNHPRDWTDNLQKGGEHENDAEGVLAIIRKGPQENPFGTLEGIVTVFHDDFYSFTPVGSPLTAGSDTDGDGMVEDIDGDLTVDGSHPLTAQEAEGHGLKAWPFIGDFVGGEDQDGVVYYPTGVAEQPESGNDRDVGYALRSLFDPGTLWDIQMAEAELERDDASTYASWGTFKGDGGSGCGGIFIDCPSDAAHAPWGWDDHDDGPTFRGEAALDPAHLVDHYFDYADASSSFSPHYVHSTFLEDLKSAGYGGGRVPRGWPGLLAIDGLLDKFVGVDPDGDGLHSCDEIDSGSNLNSSDTDGDGVADGVDAFPTDPSEWLDTDGDVVGDNADTDDDGDGVPDSSDAFPLDPERYA